MSVLHSLYNFELNKNIDNDVENNSDQKEPSENNKSEINDLINSWWFTTEVEKEEKDKNLKKIDPFNISCDFKKKRNYNSIQKNWLNKLLYSDNSSK